jgi:hypothetical protein
VSGRNRERWRRIAVAVLLAAGCGKAASGPRLAHPATTPAEARQIARALTSVVGAPAGGFPIETTESGATVVRLGGRFRQVAVAGRAADGTLRTACVSSAREAEAFLVATPGPAPAGAGR